jgi:hypothetical protein
MNLGSVELIIILFVVSPALTVWALFDAARRPQQQWASASQNQTVWITVLAVSVFACCPGVIVAIVYLAAIRPKLNEISGY